MFCGAHYFVGKEALNLSGLKTTEEEKCAFLSGLVFADIGRLKLDKVVGIESDSKKFSRVMKKHIKTSTEKWFFLGVLLHIFTDKKTKLFLKKVFKTSTVSYLCYIKRCSLLEYYFFKNNKEYLFIKGVENFNLSSVIFLINALKLTEFSKFYKEDVDKKIKCCILSFYKNINKAILSIPFSLLKNTYESLGLISVSERNFEDQAISLIGASVVALILIKNKLKKDISSFKKIEGNITKELNILHIQSARFLKRVMYFYKYL